MATLFDTLAQRAKQAWQYVGQLPAGAIEGTVADSHIAADTTPQGRAQRQTIARAIQGAPLVGPIASYIAANTDYRPAIVDQPGAIYGIIKALTTGEAPEEGSFAGNAIARANAASERTNRALGVGDPTNPAQMATRIAGSVLIPGPKIPKASTALGKTARVAAEAVLPMRQTGIKTAVATAVPVGLAIREGVDAIAPSDKYTGIADQFKGQPADEFAGIGVEVPQDEFAGIGQPETNEFDGIGNVDTPTNAADVPMSWQEKALVAGSIVAGGAIGLSAARWGMNRIKGGPQVLGELTGEQIISPTKIAKKQGIRGAAVQADQPVRNMANEFMTPAQAKQFNYKSDLMVPQAMGSKIKHAAITGELPGSAVKAEPLAPLLEAVQNDLDPTEFQMLSDGLLAGSTLDDIRATGVQAAFNDKTPAELQTMFDLVNNDPKLSKYATAIKNQYRTMLDYRKDMGLIDDATYNELLAARPNYVHMSRDVTRRGGNNQLFGRNGSTTRLDEQLARMDEEFGGVQVGATRNPIDELQSRWANTIRVAETNQHKRWFFDNMMNSRAVNETVPTSNGKTTKLIQRIDGQPDSMEGIHTIYENGRKVYYKIGDPLLDEALKYNPRAQAHWIFSGLRQIGQFFTTGAGNPLAAFGATVSPVYDTLTGMVLRPAGYQIGAVNEALNKLNLSTIGYLDPTILASPVIGGLRGMFDDITGAMASNLSEQLIKGYGFAFDRLGPQKTQVMRDWLQSKYDASIRSMLDAGGVSSYHSFGMDAPRSAGIGLEEFAPDFARGMSSRARAATLAGDHSYMEGVLANGKNAFAQVKGNLISRMYSSVMKNMQEGFRYQFAATNKSKVKNLQQLNELMSTTRRIASDAGQFGGNQTLGQVADSVMYANVGMQALGELADRVRKAPLQTTANLMATIGTLAAIRYGALLTDPEARQRLMDRTDVQNAAVSIGFEGMDIPIEPMLRSITGPLFAVLDRTLMNEDGTFNPGVADAIYQWFDDGDNNDPKSEELSQAASDAFKAGIMAANPINPLSAPMVGPALAMAGADPSMTRTTGELQPLRAQNVDPMAGEGKWTDSLMSSWWSNLITSISATSVADAIDVADQWQRAFYAQNRDGSRGTSPAGAAKVALSELIDNTARTTGPAQGLLFKDYDKVQSIANTDFNIYKNKRDGMDKATQIFNQDIKNQMLTSSDPRFAMLKPTDIVPPDYANTPLAPIGVITLEAMKEVRKYETFINQLSKQVDTVRNQKTTKIDERNRQINEINEQRRYMYSQMLNVSRMAEDAIGNAIGDPNFTYQSFDPQKYQPQAPQQ